MDDRFNTTAGWVLFAGIIALGGSIASGLYFHANDKPAAECSEKMGYAMECVAEGGEEGGATYDLGTVLAAADVANGEKLFSKCASCHTITPGGANGIGPNLHAIVGKPIGKHAPGFAYSSDLANHGGNWDYENLDHWLASPKKFAAGTKMSFAGLSKPEDRAAIIAYMKANGGGPDFPAPKAADAAAPAEGAEAAPGAGPGPVEGAPAGDAEAAGGASADQPVASQQAATANQAPTN